MTDENTGNETAAEIAAKAKATEEAKTKAEAEEKAKKEADAKKTSKDYIIERKQAQLEKSRARQKELEEELEEFSPSENDSVEDLFNKRMAKMDKISAFITKYPSLEEHREKIQKYALDPSRKNIPIDEVISSAIGPDALIKLGSEMRDDADKDANARMGGGSPSTTKQPTEAEKKRAEKFGKLPGFMKGAQEAYDRL